MSYQPNWNDKRVIARVKRAYGFAIATMSTEKPTHWSQAEIDKHFGYHSNKLSIYLRNLLLICVNENYDMNDGITKQYILSNKGVAFLKDNVLSYINSVSTALFPSSVHLLDTEIVCDLYTDLHGSEMDSGEFSYEDKADRLWHPIQNVKSTIRNTLLNRKGYRHHYDIRSCAPTLIYEAALKAGAKFTTNAITEYLQDPDYHRKSIAKIVDIDSKTTKTIINALFCGARLGENPQYAIYKLLHCNKLKMMLLREHPLITNLVSEIRECWRVLRDRMIDKIITDKLGRTRRLPPSSKQKWAVYFSLEREVLEVVRNHLQKSNNKHFLLHDGWYTRNYVDLPLLLREIKIATGFNVTITESEVL